MKALYTILNIIAAAPILFYPLAISLSIMVFDAPGSADKIGNRLAYFAILGYPVWIAVCIGATWYFRSLIPAVLGLVPAIYLLFILFSSQMTLKKQFDEARRDYACDDRTFIQVELLGNRGQVRLFERIGFLKYISGSQIAFIYEGSIVPETKRLPDMRQGPIDYLASCRNQEGKTILEKYELLERSGLERKEFERAKRDFVISEDSFIELSDISSNGPGSFTAVMRIRERSKNGVYLTATLGSIRDGKIELPRDPRYALSSKFQYTAEEYVAKARNEKGESPVELYPYHEQVEVNSIQSKQ